MGVREFIIEGFCFENEIEYNRAKSESENVAYIKANTDLKDMKKLLKLYHKLLEKKTFKTVIGFQFLMEIRIKLLASGIVSKEYLEAIPVEAFFINKESQDMQEIRNDNLKKYKDLLHNSKVKNRNLGISLAGLVVVVVIMFVMAITSDKTAFNDYKTSVIDEYASWDEELKAKEAKLNQREEELDNREEELDNREEELDNREEELDNREEELSRKEE